jgi:hypothetical protein
MDKLLKMLTDTKGGFATLESIVEKPATKKSRKDGWPYEEVFEAPVTVRKVEYVNIRLSYEASVNRQRVREDLEPDFASYGLPWGEWKIPNLVIQHKGELYLRYYEDMSKNWAKSEHTWRCGERAMCDDEVKKFTEEFGPVHKDGSGRQEVGKPVRPKNVKFRNIVRLVFDGKTYEAQQLRLRGV